MFLRCTSRKKNGKSHRYWSIVESRRLAGGNVAQRQVLYLGEINDSQEAGWRKTISVFDEEKRQPVDVWLFPDDRPVAPDEANAIRLRITDIKLLSPRSFGDCWLGCLLWEELGLARFWQEKLGCERGGVHHQLEDRVEAHIFVAFLGYCLTVTLRMKLRPAALGLTPRAVLEEMSPIQMVDVEIPTTDGRVLALRKHTDPEPDIR